VAEQKDFRDISEKARPEAGKTRHLICKYSRLATDSSSNALPIA
jgi:hypothetical protein